MRIGIVRHFKVKLAYPEQRLVSAAEVNEWFDRYDRAEVEMQEAELGGLHWEVCYTSDMPRAVRTAKSIYHGPVVESSSLRELPLPALSGRLRMPFLWWAVAVKCMQLTSPTNRKEIEQLREGFRVFLDEAMGQGYENILIVSHASMMREMRKELQSRGFRGPKFSYAENGKLYVFEK